MPFHKEAIKELRTREGWSHFTLGTKLGEITDDEGLDSLAQFTPGTIINWEKGKTSPSVKALDPLYVLADKYNHNDLVFYSPPEKTD